MNRKLYALAALATLALISASAGASADTLPTAKTESTYDASSNGGYDKSTTTKNTDANGTDTVHKATKSVDVDSKGNTTSTVDIKDTTDPKGLMNKSTTEVKNKSIVKNGKTEVQHVKTVNGKTVEKTDDISSQ